MVLKSLAEHYHYIWYAFLGVAALKVLLSFIFNPSLRGGEGFVTGLLKWYGENDKETADTKSIRNSMTLLNVVSVIAYILLAVYLGFKFFLMLAMPHG